MPAPSYVKLFVSTLSMLTKKVRRLFTSYFSFYTVVVALDVSVTFFSNFVDPPTSEPEFLSFLQELKTRAAITPAIINSFFINLYCVFILRMFDYFTRRGITVLAILILC